MKNVSAFFLGCVSTFTSFVKKRLTPMGVFFLFVLGMQYLILERVSHPVVGDYQVFQQVQGTRNGSDVRPVDPQETQQRVGLFVSNLITTGYDWQPGQAVEEEGVNYPRSFHAASFYFDMESDLRQKWLLSRAVSYQKAGFPFKKFLDGQFLSTVELSGNPMVKQLSNHRWQAEIKGVRVVVSPEKSNQGAAFREKLGFKFVIQEVQPQSGHSWGLENSVLNTVLNQTQKDGLKIIDFKELA